MKTLTRLLLVVAVVGVIYFGTIGRDTFFRILDTVNDVIEVFAKNYLKK